MSNKVMDYAGYQGSVEVSIEDDCVFGKVLHIDDLVTYEADSPRELEAAFRQAVDEYIVFCQNEGREPSKPFKGSFNVRVGEELHKQASMFATRIGLSLNDLVKESLTERISRAENNETPTIVHNHNTTFEYVVLREEHEIENYGEEKLTWTLGTKENALQH